MITWICRFFHTLKHLITMLFITPSEGESNDSLIINFKCDRDRTLRLTVDLNSTVKQIKEIIANKLSFSSPGQVAIIFAGKELPDHLVISSCDLANESLMHVIQLKCKGQSADSNLLSESVSKLTISDSNASSSSNSKSYFTVYCSSCKSVQFGRIRVRCVECKDSAVILTKDPTSWQDVLGTRCITGKCFNSQKPCSQLDSVYVEFYFKCSACTIDNSHCVPLHQVRMNSRVVACLSCQDVSERIFLFDCSARHSLCLECFTSYCLSKINERQFILDGSIGYTLQCPMNCENSRIKVTHHFHLMGLEAYLKYQRFAAEEYTLAVGGIFCPRPQCGAGIVPEEEGTLCDKITCGACSFVFCAKCRNGYHLGQCESVVASSDGSDRPSLATGISNTVEVESYHEILRISKPCPKCKTPTERDGGCMHMVCTRSGCSFEWCWLCQNEWTRDCMASHWFD